MRLRHIEVFNAIMLTGSVSGAARLLNVTQPAVSRILAHAELQLGFPLFQRSKSRLIPTSEAQTLYPHIAQLFNQLDDVQRLAANLRGGHSEGELHILSVLALSYDILPRALQLFRKQHPKVVVTIESLHSPQIVSSLALQEADVGFVFSAIAHPSLEQQNLHTGHMVCVAPKGLLKDSFLAQGSITLGDLGGMPMITLQAGDPIGMGLNQACDQMDVTLNAIVRVQTYHAALALAHHGLGATLIDAYTARSANLGLVDVLALQPDIAVPVTALRPLNRPASQLATTMTQCMQKVLENVSPQPPH